MVQDKPLIGQGYLAYKELAETFGDPVLGSPHNEWLRIFAEEGVIVGLVGIAFLVATAVTLARVPGWLGTGILAGFLGYVDRGVVQQPVAVRARVGRGLRRSSVSAWRWRSVPVPRRPRPTRSSRTSSRPTTRR